MVIVVVVFLSAGGCVTTPVRKQQGVHFVAPVKESEWIRNGEPVEFEGEMWYPQDDIEILEDSEMLLIGNYEETQLFIEKVDVRPYNRLYTKFGQHKFRIFKKLKGRDDQGSRPL
jgi:hypothetical protein